MCYYDIEEIADMWEEHHEDNNKLRKDLIYCRQVFTFIYAIASIICLLILMYYQTRGGVSETS